jgi:hypothetical protein
MLRARGTTVASCWQQGLGSRVWAPRGHSPFTVATAASGRKQSGQQWCGRKDRRRRPKGLPVGFTA